MPENKVSNKIFMNKEEEFIKQLSKLRKEKLNYFYSSSNNATLFKKWDLHKKE
jgi:hypothetical protein